MVAVTHALAEFRDSAAKTGAIDDAFETGIIHPDYSALLIGARAPARQCCSKPPRSSFAVAAG